MQQATWPSMPGELTLSGAQLAVCGNGALLAATQQFVPFSPQIQQLVP
jgi:hypothetical protein